MGKTTLSLGWFVEKGSEPAVHVLQRRLVFQSVQLLACRSNGPVRLFRII